MSAAWKQRRARCQQLGSKDGQGVSGLEERTGKVSTAWKKSTLVIWLNVGRRIYFVTVHIYVSKYVSKFLIAVTQANKEPNKICNRLQKVNISKFQKKIELIYRGS